MGGVYVLYLCTTIVVYLVSTGAACLVLLWYMCEHMHSVWEGRGIVKDNYVTKNVVVKDN